MTNKRGHSILCAWPYRPCAAVCGTATEATSSKFTCALAERLWTLSLDTNQDADLGDADTFGWFALFEQERAMLAVDSVGFVSVAVFESTADARKSWDALEQQWLAFEDDAEQYA